MLVRELPKGCYLVIYMPVDLPDTKAQIDPEAWMVGSYEEACQSIDEFIKGGDFIPEVDARFEIFDDGFRPVGDQRMIEALVLEVLNEEYEQIEGRVDEAIGSYDRSIAERREEVLLQEPPEASTTTASTSTSTPDPKKEEAKPVKEVQFDDIQIEDNRS